MNVQDWIDLGLTVVHTGEVLTVHINEANTEVVITEVAGNKQYSFQPKAEQADDSV